MCLSIIIQYFQSTDDHLTILSTPSNTIYGIFVDVSTLAANSASEYNLFALFDAQYSSICIESLECWQCTGRDDCEGFLASKTEALMGDSFLNYENVYRNEYPYSKAGNMIPS